jgi:hypothetical protein
MKHIWSILCQNSSVDSNTNLLSLFSCVEELNVAIDKEKMPKDNNLFVQIAFQLVSFWTVADKNKKNVLGIKLEVFDPNGKSLGVYDKDFNVAEKAPRFRSIISINGIKVTEAGRYIIKVLQKEDGSKKFKTVAELPLDIKIEYK